MMKWILGAIASAIIGGVAWDILTNDGAVTRRILGLEPEFAFEMPVASLENGGPEINDARVLFHRFRENTPERELRFEPPEFESVAFCEPFPRREGSAESVLYAFLGQFKDCILWRQGTTKTTLAPQTGETHLLVGSDKNYYCRCEHYLKKNGLTK